MSDTGVSVLSFQFQRSTIKQSTVGSTRSPTLVGSTRSPTLVQQGLVFTFQFLLARSHPALGVDFMHLFPFFYSYLTHTQHFSHTSPNLHWRSIGEVLEKHQRSIGERPKAHRNRIRTAPKAHRNRIRTAPKAHRKQKKTASTKKKLCISEKCRNFATPFSDAYTTYYAHTIRKLNNKNLYNHGYQCQQKSKESQGSH